ncbi:helix-turn-helix domain-containing protein [Tenggerimyces flavus]|uniref:Helix-turn-helix domain-containing protein n=1 Tax=Tenggerimyces flavus TaxID=1708749 RepID=A0ABV7Y8A3_9ACTN|nr:AraC family transcriptional regulator [Tenggerimyces flavus]MBM7785441.1 AraC-like DNA-binding protein/quercetin dioxygenase-like cupin family protein [Tenggerimyces flavus]
MEPDTRILVSDGPATRIGQLVLAGEVVDDEPWMPSPLRTMDAYILSFVFGGSGSYRHADGHLSPIEAGSVTVVLPNEPHWYGTAPGETWTELFAVFTGPLFDLLANVGIVGTGGPHHPRATPSATTLRTLLSAAPRSQTAAEHQLLGLADWLIDTARPSDESGLSAAVAGAIDLLADDLTASLSMRTVAERIALPYDTFRRRFTAEVGSSPLAFRNGRRLQAAANLLRLTDLTTREIARTLGYTDEFHLSKRFRAHFGTPPRTYRLANRRS